MTSAAAVPRSHPGSPVRRSIAVRPSHAVGGGLRGLAAGATAVSLVAAGIAGQNLHLLGWIGDAMVGIFLIVLAMAVVSGALGVLGWIVRRAAVPRNGLPGPAPWIARLSSALADPLLAASLTIVAILALGREGGPLSFLGALVPFEIVIGFGALTGMIGGVGIVVAAQGSGRTARIVGGTAVAIAVVMGTLSVAWAAMPGLGDGRIREAAALDVVAQLDLPDPSLPGTYRVTAVSYGSGIPARRAEFGVAATWRTQPVNAAAVLDRPDGIATLYADALWGFDMDTLPLNGLAWYSADAPVRLPVVLIAHGNHAAGQDSDPGYAYLAEHLASRGMFVTSVDENFLNGDAVNDFGGAEMEVRAWLLLQHLEVLRGWNADPGHPLYDRLDLDRIALIGHSRGGEAALLAAELEAGGREIGGGLQVPRGFGIRSVVGLAPSDGMARGAPPILRDADYLVIQGAHDGDLPGFSGLRAYHRTEVGPGGMKAAVYIGRANHGRFNTVWNDGDAGPVLSWMLERGSLLSASEQQRTAKAIVAAFLARSLQADLRYDAFLRDPRAGRAWLPDDVIETHWETGDRITLSAMKASRIDRAGLESAGFERAAIVDPMLRDGTPQADRALHLAWTSEAELDVPIASDEAARLDPRGSLTLSLGTPGSSVPDVVVALRDHAGSEAALRMSDVSPVRPVIPVRLWKIDGMAERYVPAEALRWPAERFLQTHAIDLALFVSENPTLDLERLASVAVRFDGASEAFVDDIGFEPAAGPEPGMTTE